MVGAQQAGTISRRALGGWAKAAAALLLLNALVGAYLEIRLYQTGEALIPPIMVIAVLSTVLAGSLWLTRHRGVCIAAAAVMVVDLLGSAPHSLDNLAHGSGVEEHVFGGIELVVVLATLAVTATTAIAWRRVQGERT